MTGQSKDLTRGHPARVIVVFAIPLLIGNIFQQMYNMADMVIVGRTISTQALAAIGATGAIAFLVVGMSFGITSGFTVITAQRFGAGDHDGMRRSVATSIFLSLVISIVITAAAVSTAYWMFELMRTPADIIDDSYRYIVVIYGGTVVTIFFNLFAGVLRAVGDSITPLLFLIVACIVNIVLDYVFIVNFHMGVAGAGWATVAAQALSVILCLVYSMRKFPILKLKRQDWKLDWDFCKKHLVIGFSMGMQMAIIAVSTIFFQVGVNSLGTDSVKAFSAAVKIDQLAILAAVLHRRRCRHLRRPKLRRAQIYPHPRGRPLRRHHQHRLVRRGLRPHDNGRGVAPWSLRHRRQRAPRRAGGADVFEHHLPFLHHPRALVHLQERASGNGQEPDTARRVGGRHRRQDRHDLRLPHMVGVPGAVFREPADLAVRNGAAVLGLCLRDAENRLR